jgi:hypothetical protein
MRAFVIERRGVTRFPVMWWRGRSIPDWSPDRWPDYDWEWMQPAHYGCCG